MNRKTFFARALGGALGLFGLSALDLSREKPAALEPEWWTVQYPDGTWMVSTPHAGDFVSDSAPFVGYADSDTASLTNDGTIQVTFTSGSSWI